MLGRIANQRFWSHNPGQIGICADGMLKKRTSWGLSWPRPSGVSRRITMTDHPLQRYNLAVALAFEVRNKKCYGISSKSWWFRKVRGLTKLLTIVILPPREAISGMDTDITQNCIIHGGPTYPAGKGEAIWHSGHRVLYYYDRSFSHMSWRVVNWTNLQLVICHLVPWTSLKHTKMG